MPTTDTAAPTGRAASASDVYRMPYEVVDTSTRGATERLLDVLGSDTDSEDPGARRRQTADDESDRPAGADESDPGEPAEESEEQEGLSEPDEESDTTVTMELDGKEVEIPLTELRDGYLRQQDYTKKTQALAEERKAFSAEHAQTRATRVAYAERLSVVESALTEMAPPQPDWDRLRQEDPAEFAAQWAEHQRMRDDLQAVRAERSRLAAAEQEDQATALQEHLAGESQKLLVAFPDWSDAAKAAEGLRGLREYASGMGFTGEDLSNVHDHRLIVLLDKAAKYDALTTKGRDQVREKRTSAPVLRPGTRNGGGGKGTEIELKKGMSRLRQTGSLKDAADLIARMSD